MHKISYHDQIEFRRGLIMERMAKGDTPTQLCKDLKVSRATISSDVKILRRRVANDIRDFPKQVSHQHRLIETNANLAIAKLWRTLDDQSLNLEKNPKLLCMLLGTLGNYLTLKRDLLMDAATVAEIVETELEQNADTRLRDLPYHVPGSEQLDRRDPNAVFGPADSPNYSHKPIVSGGDPNSEPVF